MEGGGTGLTILFLSPEDFHCSCTGECTRVSALRNGPVQFGSKNSSFMKIAPPPSLSLCNLVENWVVLLHQQKVYGIASSCQNCKYIELSLCVCRKTGLEFSVYGVPGACQRFLKFQRTRGSAKC